MKNNLPKILITLSTIFYGTIPIIADLSDSHLLNPSWMPHAKFHLAWLLSTNSLLALFSIYLIWIKGKAIYAGLIGIIVMGGFWIAAFTRNFYDGLFVDPNLEVSEIMGLHPNVFAFIFVSLFLVVGTFLQFKVSKSEKGSG
tara:strand:+ start:709 stop:1134 length:426 start_codon:yes stop_codon:yes gene_type:complete